MITGDTMLNAFYLFFISKNIISGFSDRSQTLSTCSDDCLGI